MQGGSAHVETHTTYPLPSTLRVIWLIASRSAIESLRDRTTAIMSTIFALVIPTAIVLFLIVPAAGHVKSSSEEAGFGLLLALYIYVVGMFPASGTTSIASGVFAGEKERGCLTPLLVTPASNLAIFVGKVFGAVMPTMVYAATAVACLLIETGLFAGTRMLRLLPPTYALSMLALIPCVATLGAAVASVISSRVRTYNSAQTFTSLLLLPIMAALFGLVFLLRYLQPWLQAAALLGVVAISLLVLTFGAATWRREEVLARQ